MEDLPSFLQDNYGLRRQGKAAPMSSVRASTSPLQQPYRHYSTGDPTMSYKPSQSSGVGNPAFATNFNDPFNRSNSPAPSTRSDDIFGSSARPKADDPFERLNVAQKPAVTKKGDSFSSGRSRSSSGLNKIDLDPFSAEDMFKFAPKASKPQPSSSTSSNYGGKPVPASASSFDELLDSGNYDSHQKRGPKNDTSNVFKASDADDLLGGFSSSVARNSDPFGDAIPSSDPFADVAPDPLFDNSFPSVPPAFSSDPFSSFPVANAPPATAMNHQEDISKAPAAATATVPPPSAEEPSSLFSSQEELSQDAVDATEEEEVWYTIEHVVLRTNPMATPPPSRPPPPIGSQQTQPTFHIPVAAPRTKAEPQPLAPPVADTSRYVEPSWSEKFDSRATEPDSLPAVQQSQKEGVKNWHFESDTAPSSTPPPPPYESVVSEPDNVNGFDDFVSSGSFRRQASLFDDRTNPWGEDPGSNHFYSGVNEDGESVEAAEQSAAAMRAALERAQARAEAARLARGKDREKEKHDMEAARAAREKEREKELEAARIAREKEREKEKEAARARQQQQQQQQQAEAKAKAKAEARAREEEEARQRAQKVKTPPAPSPPPPAAIPTADEFEDFFSGFSSQQNRAPTPPAAAVAPTVDPVWRPAGPTPAPVSSFNASSNPFGSTAPSSVDDWADILGGGGGSAASVKASGKVDTVIPGETEERRRARLDRERRTAERAAEALREKTKRDNLVAQEQAERDRSGDMLDGEIKKWAQGKQGNIRALLSTLQFVLWPECNWKAMQITELIDAGAVKKAYRKATLCVHPDKVQQKGATVQQKYIAEKVFDLLKEAWNKFNSEELF